VDLKAQAANAIKFETYEMNLDIKQMRNKAAKQRRPLEEMSWTELGQVLKKAKQKDKHYYKAQMKRHEKIALPAACLALGLLALPLGLQAGTDKRSKGIMVGMGLFLLYYILLSMGWALGESGTLPPIIGMWAPNVLMSATGIYFYTRVLKDRPLLPENLPSVSDFKRKT
jgi:lipopolysaccharide export system permease protein